VTAVVAAAVAAAAAAAAAVRIFHGFVTKTLQKSLRMNDCFWQLVRWSSLLAASACSPSRFLSLVGLQLAGVVVDVDVKFVVKVRMGSCFDVVAAAAAVGEVGEEACCLHSLPFL
jgi:hypothetical protein